jgi:hypothetical protein
VLAVEICQAHAVTLREHLYAIAAKLLHYLIAVQ